MSVRRKMHISSYPSIDLELTGIKLKMFIKKAGYDVKFIQNYLQLSCPQPIYRWFKGKSLPSVDHLFALSYLLGVHMDELLVQKEELVLFDIFLWKKDKSKGRTERYCEYMKRYA